MTVKKTRKQLAAEWPTVDRRDGRIEIICPHGVGHPSQKLSGKRWVSSWMGVHGCCGKGCCGQAAFALAEMVHAGEIEAEPLIHKEIYKNPHCTIDHPGSSCNVACGYD